jgi:DNA adenine methylase
MKPFIKWPGGKQGEYGILSGYFPQKINKYVEPFVGGGAVFLAIQGCNKFYINDKSSELISLYDNIKTKNKEFFTNLYDICYTWELIQGIVENHREELIKNYLRYSSGIMSELEWYEFNLEFISNNMGELRGILVKEFDIDIKHFIGELGRSLLQKTRRMKKLENQRGKLLKEDIIKNIEASFKSAYYTHFRYIYNNYSIYKISSELKSAIFYFIREFCYSAMFRYNKTGQFNVPYGGISYNRKKFYT